MEEPSSSAYNDGGERRAPRPESTMALDFSNALDGAFNMNGDLLKLGSAVEEKKQTVQTQSQELQALEARLKATEERLKKAGTTEPSSTGQQEATSAGHTSSSSRQMPQSRPPQGRVGALAAGAIADRAPTPLDPSRNDGMPGNMPGALPETPSPSGRQNAQDYYSQRRS